MQWLVTKSRRAVQNREITKSELIRSVHKFRLAYIGLAKKMVSEGFLPKEELIFHLTHSEIGQLLETRDPVLVAKCTRRHRLFPKWDKMDFPEIMQGEPQAIEEDTVEFFVPVSFYFTFVPVFVWKSFFKLYFFL